MTETDVIRANMHIVDSLCAQTGRSIDPADRRQVALLGMLHAIRTYRITFGSFQRYASQCVSVWIREEERRQRVVRRIESALSLDMRVYRDGSPVTYLDLIAGGAADPLDILCEHEGKERRHERHQNTSA